MHILHAVTHTYLEDLRKQNAQPGSTPELSYRPALSNFLTGAAAALGRVASFTNEAKLSKFGRPDYVVADGLKRIGEIEAEAWNADLAHLTGSAKKQNDLFRENLPNFLQTNHFDFRLFADKHLVAQARLPVPAATGQIIVSESTLNDVQAVLERFLDSASPPAQSAEAIAAQLAKRAVFLRDEAQKLLANPQSTLEEIYSLYKETLFADIDRVKFADVYAQTFTYGLFLAWLSTDKTPFVLADALSAIPKAVPPIRVLLKFGGDDDLPPEFEWIVKGICTDLTNADKEAATKHKAGIADPLVAFYETFLGEYDPTLRKSAGVYYTPDSVVDFLVRAVDSLLQTHFNKLEGLADESVRLLDPATGTGTFLARAYRQVKDTMTENGDGGTWPDRAKDHVAVHFNGFERLPAAYTLAHVKLRQQMEILGVPLGNDTRLPVYLADTMMNHVPEQGVLPGQNILSREIRDAAAVRNGENILVILGNPPYFGKSDNASTDSKGKPTFIGKLMETYYQVDGVPLGEKNPKWLQNDYVKFLRFAQWRVERTGQGIVAFITDNSYLDNPTFRGMRRSLSKTFDEIYLLDLHGNSKKKETPPEGGKDENVFDITQGVAICLMVKYHPEDLPHV